MLLKLESTGVQVKCLQYGLHILCCSPKAFTGYFGTATESSVRKFQNIFGLTVDGQVGDVTWNSLCGEIRPIQRALSSKGYYSGYVDGVPGEETYNAVINFQNKNGLSPDGQVGSATRIKLMREGSVEVGDSDFPLKEGDSGDKVNYLQYGLRILCCSPGSIDGVFGAGTTAAVKKFQTKYSLTSDGIVGSGTWSKMESLILEIQKALLNKGYDIGTADGVAGPGTYDGVINFQKANGLSPDGQVGPATREKLMGTSTDGSSDAFPLKPGSKGPYVFSVQYGLWILCINPNGIDGGYGVGTATAVKKFQSNNGLSSDGTVGTITWEKLRSCIRPIQQALVNRGYHIGTVDGIADKATYDAIKDFQTVNGLTSDGMVGNATRAKLGLAAIEGGSGTTSSVLKFGSNGSLVRYMQHILDSMGYHVSINGTFDEATSLAVKSFQSSYGLTSDGIVGAGTWAKIFEKYHVNAAGSGITKLVNVAKHELSWGFIEDNGNNITPYGEWYGMNGSAWCAMFVSWCAKQAGLLGVPIPKFAYCPLGMQFYKARGKYFTRGGGYVPKVGDTIFFWSTSLGRVAHTGIVVATDSYLVTTIEGNTSDGVRMHTYDKHNTYIHGYGCNSDSSSPESLPSEEEIESALRDKWLQFLKIALNYAPGFTLELNQEYTLLDSPVIKISTEFGPGVELFNNTPYQITATIQNGVALSGSTSLLDVITTTFPIISSDELLAPIIEISMAVKDGKVKMDYTLEDGWATIGFCYTGETNITEVVTKTFSFKYKISIKNGASSAPPELAYVPEKVHAHLQTVGNIVLAAACLGLVAFAAYKLDFSQVEMYFSKFLEYIGRLFGLITN
ncbi:MAG: peptidoglycan-binding protein [Clostridiales bacterium]|nr:peptidoglycan-binding protein [Clostridiales bacterium]